jgi:hypothetical protein
MRIIILSAVAAMGLGCIGVSGALALPAIGSAIKDSAAASRVTMVEDRDHHHKHCHVRHGHRHCD